MDEILKKLLQSELLSEETKSEITEQWNESVEQYRTQLREEVIMEVRSELAEQWTKEKGELVDNIDKFINENIQTEISELKDDIDRFRDLESEYAEKLVEEKHNLAQQLSEELDQLVDKIDAFFEVRIAEEIEELKEDMEVVKQNALGRRIFDAFAEEYSQHYVDEDSIQNRLNAELERGKDLEQRLQEKERQLNSMVREAKMTEVLSQLEGRKKEQMEFILKNVETTKLQEAYNHFISRVIKEDTIQEKKDEKVTIIENNKEPETKIVTGNESSVVTEEQQKTEEQDAKKSAAFERLRKLASVK